MKCKITNLDILRQNGLRPATIYDYKIIRGYLKDDIEVYYESNNLQVYDEFDNHTADLEKC
ncbi:hypothetical protein AB6819_00980 [Carnobacterium maltaromaticum]|uniref:hypothetical protein n=1 Tax=Carnobacterium maltaromaticum TaxID=2751 RepID=UPI0039B08BA9